MRIKLLNSLSDTIEIKCSHYTFKDLANVKG